LADATAEANKRKGVAAPKVITKRQKTVVASAAASTIASMAASANDDKEVAENVGGGSGSITARTGGEHSAASLDLGDNDLVDTALQGMGGGFTAEPSIVAPMLSVLGDESSSSEGEGAGSGDASLPREGEAASTDLRRPTTGLIEAFEDKAEVSSPIAPLQSMRF